MIYRILLLFFLVMQVIAMDKTLPMKVTSKIINEVTKEKIYTITIAGKDEAGQVHHVSYCCQTPFNNSDALNAAEQKFLEHIRKDKCKGC